MVARRRSVHVPMKGDLFSAPVQHQPATAAQVEVPIKHLHRAGQVTSEATLQKTRKSRGGFYMQVHGWLVHRGAAGAIPEDFDAADLIDVRRAFHVLKKKHLIEWTGQIRVNNKGNPCEVWRVKQ